MVVHEAWRHGAQRTRSAASGKVGQGDNKLAKKSSSRLEADKLQDDARDLASLQHTEQEVLRRQHYITLLAIFGLMLGIAIDERCHREDEENPDSSASCYPRTVVMLKSACLVSTVCLVVLIFVQWKLNAFMTEVEDQLQKRTKAFRLAQVSPLP